MKNQFNGKVAVVTGGTQGLGETIARTLAERGAAGLVIVGRNKKRGKAVADDLTQGGCKTVFVAADLANLAATRKIVPAAEKAFATPECGLWNNPGPEVGFRERWQNDCNAGRQER